jgi:predicted Fe-S protein YdhL (DUF1289 family)
MTDSGPLSPCVNLCTLDREGICVGCYRSIDEIARWGSMTLSERRQVLEAVAERRRRAQRGSVAAND